MTGGFAPTEPPATAWRFPDPRDADDDVVAVGGDLEPGTILAAYRSGMFPMPLHGRLAWWSPEPRAVIPLGGLRVTRSLRRSIGRFEIRVDTAFDDVIDACADPTRPHGWITDEIADAYKRLHRLGWAHSVEAWSVDDGSLGGGLYGLVIGGLFAGESMFHRRADASKVALAGLVSLLREGSKPANERLLDVQWRTDHLARLGAVELAREDYIGRLASVIHDPPPPAFWPNLENRP